MANATKSVAIRLSLDGRAEVKAGLKDIGDTGKQTGQDVAKSFDQASGAAERSRAVFDRLVEAARQARQMTQGQSSWNASLGLNRPSAASAGAPSSEAEWLKAEAAAAQDLTSRSAALRAQIDPLGTAQLRMNMAVADADQLLAKKAITEAEHAGAVALAAKEYAQAEQALKHFSAAGGMSTAQMMALTHSVRGAIDAVIAGRNPVQALAMESGHLSYALGGGTGLSGIAALAKNALTALLSPTALMIAGFAGLGAGVLTAITAYRAAIMDQKELQASLGGVGRAAGISAEQMELIAQAVHDSAGVTVADARKMEEQFAQTGKIGGDMFGSLIMLVRDYAATTHQDADAATKDLAAIFADPAKGVDTLIQKVGGIDDKTRQYVLTLSAQGERQRAQMELLKVLPDQLQKASDQTDGWGRTTHALGLAWTGVWESIKQAVSGSSLAQQLDDLQKERAAAAKGFGMTVEGVMTTPRSLKDIDSDIGAVQGKLKGLDATARATAAAVDADAKSIAVGNLARSVLGFSELDALINGQKDLNKQMADPAVKARIANLQQATDAQDAYARAIGTYLTPAQKAAALDDLETKALNDRTPAQKAATAAKREEIEIAGKLMTSAQAASDVDRSRAKAFNEASRAGQERAKQVQTETKVLDANTAAALTGARAWLLSAAAGMQADAARKGLTDSIKKGSEADQRAREILRQQIADMADEGGRQARSVTDQVAEQKRLNDAVAAGAMTTEDARQQLQTWSSLRPLIIAQDLAEGDAKRDLTSVIKALTAAYANDNAEQRRTQAQVMVEEQRIGIDLLQQENGLRREGDDARERDLNVLQAKSELLRQHISLASQEGQEYIANAKRATILNQNLRLDDASRQEIEGLFDSVANDAGNFFRSADISWKSFGNLGVSVLQDIEDEFVKLALINPLKNALFGGSGPTLSSVGGILGGAGKGGFASAISDAGSWLASIFHDGLDAGAVGAGQGPARAVPSRIFHNASRKHGGGLVGDEVPIIARKGEEVGWPGQLAAKYGKMTPMIHFAHNPTVVIQGGAGPAEIQAMQASFEELNTGFERRVAQTVAQIQRRA